MKFFKNPRSPRLATTKEDIIQYNNAGYAFIQTVEGIGHIYRKRK